MYGRGRYGKALFGVYTVKDAAATVTSSSTIAASFLRFRAVSAALTSDTISMAAPRFSWAMAAQMVANTALDVQETVENLNGAEIVGASGVVAVGVLRRPGAAAVVASVSIAAAPSLVIRSVPEAAVSQTALTALATMKVAFAAAMDASASIEANGRGIYVTIDDNSSAWGEIPAAEDQWTKVPDKQPTWLETPVNG